MVASEDQEVEGAGGGGAGAGRWRRSAVWRMTLVAMALLEDSVWGGGVAVWVGGQQGRLPVGGPWSGGGLDLGGILLWTAVLEVSLECGLWGGVMH